MSTEGAAGPFVSDALLPIGITVERAHRNLLSVTRPIARERLAAHPLQASGCAPVVSRLDLDTD